MAMHVLLRFDDDEKALSFVEACDAGQLETYDDHEPIVLYGKVAALYKAPTMFCEGHGGKKTALGFTMGMKWGWWVCATCKKPSKLYWDNVVQKQSSLGKNVYSMYFTDEKTAKEES